MKIKNPDINHTTECLVIIKFESGNTVLEDMLLEDALDKYAECETGLTGMLSVDIFTHHYPKDEELPDPYQHMSDEDKQNI